MANWVNNLPHRQTVTISHARITSGNPPQRRGSPFILEKSLAFLVASIALLGSEAAGQVSTGWRGDGATNAWSSAANWDNGVPGGSARNLFFGNGWVANPAGNNSLTANNDLAGYAGFRITFEDTPLAVDPAYTITGNGFTLFDFFNVTTLAPRIENDSTSLQTFNLSGTLTLTNAVTAFAEINPVNGDLLFSATTPIAIGTGTQLRIFGNNGKTVTFNGAISGVGNTVAINQNSNVVFGAANSYSGETFVNAGKLQFAQGGSTASSVLRVGDTTGTASAELSIIDADGGTTVGNVINVRPGSSGVKTISAANTLGTNTFSGAIFLDADAAIATAAGGTLAFTGATFDLKNQTLTVGGAGTTTIGGALQNSTGSGKVIMNGTGTLNIAGAGANYMGATTVSNGRLQLRDATAFRSNASIASGATLEVNTTAPWVIGTGFTITGTGTLVKSGGANWEVGSASGGVTVNLGSGALVDIQGGTIQNNFTRNSWAANLASMNIAGGAMFDIYAENVQMDALTGTGTLQNGYIPLGAKLVTLGAAGGSGAFSGALQDGAGGVAVSKTGAGTQTLSGNGICLQRWDDGEPGHACPFDAKLATGAKTVAAGATLEINSSISFGARWNEPGAISGAGIINKTGGGVFGTTGAVNFSGTINLLNGRIHNDSVTGNWTGSTADVNIGASGVLDLRANDIYVDELNGTGEIWNSHPAGGGDVLFVGVANGSSSYGGIIWGDASEAADNPSGAVLSLTKQGTGTFTVTGGANVYSGATTVNNGVLRISGGDDRLSVASQLIVNGGATFGGMFDLGGLNQTVGGISGSAGTIAGVITSTAGPATLTTNVAGVTVFTTAAHISDTGGHGVSVAKSGTGAQILAGTNTFSVPR